MSEDVFDMIIHNINNASGVADDAQGNLEGEFQTIVTGGYLGNVEIWSKQIDEEDGTSFLYLALDAYEEVEDLDLAYDDAFTSVEDWEDEVTKPQHSAELEKELNETPVQEVQRQVRALRDIMRNHLNRHTNVDDDGHGNSQPQVPTPGKRKRKHTHNGSYIRGPKTAAERKRLSRKKQKDAKARKSARKSGVLIPIKRPAIKPPDKHPIYKAKEHISPAWQRTSRMRCSMMGNQWIGPGKEYGRDHRKRRSLKSRRIT
jgi:hypothetical protein